MRLRIALTAALLCLSTVALAAPPTVDGLPEEPARQTDNVVWVNANRILMFVTNHGNFGRDLADRFGQDRGTFFPFTTIEDIESGVNLTSVQYAGGIWLGGVDSAAGEIRVAVAEYNDEYVPGPMQNGTWMTDRPAFRNYHLYRDSLAANPNVDYLNWPEDQGAPTDNLGLPVMIGDQMTWTVFNDADPAQHTNNSGETSPLGIEVQQTVWAFEGSGDDTVIVSHEIPVTQTGFSYVEVSAYSTDPSQITGHDYAVEVDSLPGIGPAWLLRDVTTGAIVVDAQTDFSGDSAHHTDHGFAVVVADPGGLFRSFEVVANASGPLDPPESAGAAWTGFPTPLGSDGNGRPSDNQQVGSGKWLFHTADNGGTSGGGTRGSFEAFLERVLRNDDAEDVAGHDWEMRFTGSNDAPGIGGSWAVKYPWEDNEATFWVPFELWNVGAGTLDDSSDDYRLIPLLIDDGEDLTFSLESWGTAENGAGDLEHSVSGGDDDPFTDWVYWQNPIDMSPGTAGYDAYAAQASLGNMTPAAWAFVGDEVMARTVLVNWNGGEQPPFTQDCPEQGTVFRLTTSTGIGSATYSFTPTAGEVLTTSSQASTIYFKYKLYNMGGNTIKDFYISVWSDVDIGGVSDDAVGCAPLRNAFYAYNGRDYDSDYGAFPPAIGFRLIHGPVVPASGEVAVFDGNALPDHTNLDLHSFMCFVNGTDPDNFVESYRCMRGLNRDGTDYIDPTNGQVTTFAFSGDPVTGVGNVDTSPDDKRILASFGPFDFHPGDSQYVHFKMCVAPGVDRDDALTRLFEYLDAEPPGLAAQVDPDTLYTWMVNATDPIHGSITVGWSGSSPDGSSIDPATVQVAGLPVIDSVQVLADAPGFEGEVVRVHFPVREFILAQGAVWDYEHIPLTVTGEFTDGSPVAINTEAIIGGHISGDVNGDGSLDIVDLIALVDYMFQGGATPRYLEAANVVADDVVDIGDLIYLVSYMFQDGPPPHCE